MASAVKVIDKDMGWKKIKKNLKELNNTESKVGLFGSGSSPKNNVAARGAVNEYGTKHIPKRPFMRLSFQFFLVDYKKFILKMFGLMLDKKITYAHLVRGIGNLATKRTKKGIMTLNFIKKATSTLKRSKSPMPLIDTGEMFNSIESKEKLK